ncbi:MAG: class I SAM-dependent methyltransferase family protein [Candidatus Thermoplasmatota archaeon]|nr:class I SAM-dependent methyltransferase family protein [Candidatus Thermoplasmatota archaeon]
MKAIAIPRRSAEKELRSILRSGIVDKKKKITADENNVYVPILSGTPATSRKVVDVDLKERSVPEAPLSALLRKAKEAGLKEGTLPRRWVRYGNSVLIRYDGPDPRSLGKIIGEVLGAKSVYRFSGGISGVLRIPSLELLFGNGGPVTHLENGIRYTFDPSKVMFSPGNVGIRASMKHLDVRGKIIYDMFAGIGYFSLPLAKYGQPRHVYAVEINPSSYEFLLLNLQRNRVKNIFTTYNADCSSITLPEKADIIVMGHFASPSYIESAYHNAKIGGTIMMHHLVSSENLGDPAGEIEKKFQDLGIKHEISASRVVKSYSPHHWHMVTEVMIL